MIKLCVRQDFFGVMKVRDQGTFVTFVSQRFNHYSVSLMSSWELVSSDENLRRKSGKSQKE